MAIVAGRSCFFILSSGLVDILRAAGVQLPEPQVRFYPDGSVWTEDTRWLTGADQALRHAKPGYVGNVAFRALARDVTTAVRACPVYYLSYPGRYLRHIARHDQDGLGFVAWPGGAAPIEANETDFAGVRVVVELFCEVTAALAEEFADAMRLWFAEIGSKGVFGEMGVSSLSRVMYYDSSAFGFIVDAGRSGQETLNTLYLAILHWGIARWKPLSLINLAGRQYSSKRNVFGSDTTVALAPGRGS